MRGGYLGHKDHYNEEERQNAAYRNEKVTKALTGAGRVFLETLLPSLFPSKNAPDSKTPARR